MAPLATSRMYRSVSSTQNSDTQAYCMWRVFSLDTWVHIQYRAGCLEKCLSLPPTTCRQAWQDSEYSHSSVAFATRTRVPRPMWPHCPAWLRKAITASMDRITLKASAIQKKYRCRFCRISGNLVSPVYFEYTATT